MPTDRDMNPALPSLSPSNPTVQDLDGWLLDRGLDLKIGRRGRTWHVEAFRDWAKVGGATSDTSEGLRVALGRLVAQIGG